jgi:hypothetical protein
VRPSGTPRYIWVKLNRGYGFGQETKYGSWDDDPNYCFIFTPTTESPEESYGIRTLRNFLDYDLNGPLQEGDIIQLENNLENVDVTNCQFDYGQI